MKCRLSLAIVAALTAFGMHSPAWAGDKVAIATASSSGLYYAAGEAICRAMADRPHKEIGCAVIASRGSTSNLLGLDPLKLQFGIVQSDVQFNAATGSELFALVGAARDVRSVLSLHSEAFTVLVKSESPVAKLDDLRGKRFNLGPMGTGTRETGEAILNALGWSPGDRSNISGLEPDKTAAALCGGQVDAVAYLVGHPSRAIEQETKACPVRVVSLLRTTIEKLVQSQPHYAVVEIPGGLYAGNPKPATTIGVKATVVTLAKVPDDLVYSLVSSAFENLGELQKASPALASLDPAEMMQNGLTAPLHPGAIKYYREKGWAVPVALIGGETGNSAPPSGLDDIKSPGSIVLKPQKAPTISTDQLGAGINRPVVPPPAQQKEKWETGVEPF